MCFLGGSNVFFLDDPMRFIGESNVFYWRIQCVLLEDLMSFIG